VCECGIRETYSCLFSCKYGVPQGNPSRMYSAGVLSERDASYNRLSLLFGSGGVPFEVPSLIHSARRAGRCVRCVQGKLEGVEGV